MVAFAPMFDSVLQQFLAFIGDDVLAGHNINRFRPVVPSSSFASFSKTCWFMRQSFNARCAPAVEIPP